MKLQQAFISAALGLAMVSGAQAASQSYSSLATWQANASGLTTINFAEGSGETYRGNSHSESGVTFTANGNIFSIRTAGHDAPYHPNAYIDLEGSSLGMAFGSGITALGFLFGDFYSDPVTLSITLSNGDVFSASSPSDAYGFFGVTSDVAFTSISMSTQNLYTTFDDISFGSASVSTVPEPTSLALMGLGLLGVASMRRRKN